MQFFEAVVHNSYEYSLYNVCALDIICYCICIQIFYNERVKSIIIQTHFGGLLLLKQQRSPEVAAE